MTRHQEKKLQRTQRLLGDLESGTCQKIYDSRYFHTALNQTHHNQTTVAVHTLGVAVTSLRMYYFLNKLGISVDKEALLKGALCHDLGIVGRDEKFTNKHECMKRHPIDSVLAAREIFPDLDERTEDTICRHMWPCTPLPPHHKEGFIVTFADKYCAAIEGVSGKFYCPGTRFLLACQSRKSVPAV